MNSVIEVVIPTYNERNGVVQAILSIKSEVPDAEIIIVDDNSPDNTANLVKARFRKDKKVRVVVRKKKGGRGSAVMRGFSEGLKNKHAKYFIEMDADLCHNPKYIKQLVDTCRKADVVIASRYLPGSKVTGWSMKRKLMSHAINTLAKLLLRIPISDYTDGFRCYSRNTVKFLCSQKFRSRGYIVLSEAAFLCFKKGFVLKEVPINIHFKSVSKSNLNAKEVKEALLTLLRLRFFK